MCETGSLALAQLPRDTALMPGNKLWHLWQFILVHADMLSDIFTIVDPLPPDMSGGVRSRFARPVLPAVL